MIALAASAIIGFLAVSVLIAFLLGRWFRMQDRIHNREEVKRRLHLVLGTCQFCCCVCGDHIEYLDPTGDGLGAWWAHEHHPSDHHDARPTPSGDEHEHA